MVWPLILTWRRFIPPLCLCLIGNNLLGPQIMPGHVLADILHPAFRWVCGGAGGAALGLGLAWIFLGEIFPLVPPSLRGCGRWLAVALFLQVGMQLAPSSFSAQQMEQRNRALDMPPAAFELGDEEGQPTPGALTPEYADTPTELDFKTLVALTRTTRKPNWLGDPIWKVKGFYTRSRDGHPFLVRLSIFCCIADAQLVGVQLDGLSTEPTLGQWLEIEGKIVWPEPKSDSETSTTPRRAVLKVDSLTTVTEPADPYLYP